VFSSTTRKSVFEVSTPNMIELYSKMNISHKVSLWSFHLFRKALAWPALQDCDAYRLRQPGRNKGSWEEVLDNFIVSTIFFLFFFIFISNISIITSSFIQTRTWETMVKEGYRILAFLYMRTRYAMLLLCMFASIMGCRGTLWKGNTS